MFKQGNLFRLMGILMVVLGLGIIAVFTPVIPWLTEIFSPTEEIHPSQMAPTEPPATIPTEPAKPIEPSHPTEIPQPENTIILSEEELQNKVDELVDMANRSGDANIEYIRVKLKQDKMLVSAKGEAMGYQAETEDLEVRFEGRTVFVSGKVSALGVSPTLTAKAEINSEGGKPSVAVKEFKVGALLPLLKIVGLGLSEDKVSEIINDAIESRGLRLPFDVESIRIEDGKLIIEYK